jgi:hypothetical protein
VLPRPTSSSLLLLVRFVVDVVVRYRRRKWHNNYPWRAFGAWRGAAAEAVDPTTMRTMMQKTTTTTTTTHLSYAAAAAISSLRHY